MTENKVRKAVITIAQVQDVFADYRRIRTALGDDMSGHSFDRGARGKGFAQYRGDDTMVRSFDSKEEAHGFYGRYVEVANEVATLLGHSFNIQESATDGAESAVDAPEGADGATGEGETEGTPEDGAESVPAVPAQKRRRVRAS